VNISPFIDNLPKVAKIDPRSFSSNSASGSTSMAANIIEAMEFSPELFLLDEDTCAR
jgi:predicted ABC-class ATPase